MKLRLNTYGKFMYGKCYGCAATNFICEVSGVQFNDVSIDCVEDRAIKINTDVDFLDYLESAIDYLREGNVKDYNRIARSIEIAEINVPYGFNLLPITQAVVNSIGEYDLDKAFNSFQKLADYQDDNTKS